MWCLAISGVLALVIACITKYVYKWRNPSCKGKLPPGSMGLPLLGETFEFFKPQSSLDIPRFVKNRMERYGSLFKTNLFGRPVIVSTDPEFNHFVFLQDGISVEPWYLDSFTSLIGMSKLTSSSGTVHKYLRNMIMDHFGPQKQKDALILQVETIVSRHIDVWSQQESVELKQVLTAMSFEIGAMKLVNYNPSKHTESLLDKYASLFKGLISFPLDIPGFIYHKCRKAEHERILENKLSVDTPLTWKDYTSMTFTSHVIDETLRLANIAPMLCRRAIRDIHVGGYTIPAGWTIMLCPIALHLNPEKYKDTLDFNPWRWKGQGSNTASKDFTAFGGGARQCAGAEFAKLQMSIALHFLVTKYRWTKIKGGEIVKTPGIAFPNGLHVKVAKTS